MPPAQGTKRLSDSDVLEIFSCLYEPGKRPPPQLSFQIVPVVRDLSWVTSLIHDLPAGAVSLTCPISTIRVQMVSSCHLLRTSLQVSRRMKALP